MHGPLSVAFSNYYQIKLEVEKCRPTRALFYKRFLDSPDLESSIRALKGPSLNEELGFDQLILFRYVITKIFYNLIT